VERSLFASCFLLLSRQHPFDAGIGYYNSGLGGELFSAENGITHASSRCDFISSIEMQNSFKMP
jgi:hypothetical protein